MDPEKIFEKFGDYYTADDNTFVMGIDRRITLKLAERFRGKHVLETCTGAGFSTISLAREALHVTTIDICQKNQDQAKENVAKAGLDEKVHFILGTSLDWNLLNSIKDIDAAFLDPDWAVTGADHIYRFKDSNTRPPADLLLDTVLDFTPNIALILPPAIPKEELKELPEFELQKIILGGVHVLYCLYFGELIDCIGETELIIPVEFRK